MNICLDSRETGLQREFTQRSIPFTTQALPVGDIVFQDTNQNIHVICERKTVSDLYASILSHRYVEQRTRLLATGLPIILILEGTAMGTSPFMKNKKDPWTVVSGALTNLVLHYPTINILPTTSLTHTVDNLVMLQKKIAASRVSPTTKSITTVALPRRQDATPDFFICQLMLVRGVSQDMAQTITKHYPTISSLLSIYYSDAYTTQQKKELLKGISLGRRKLGSVVSDRIYTHFTS